MYLNQPNSDPINHETSGPPPAPPHIVEESKHHGMSQGADVCPALVPTQNADNADNAEETFDGNDFPLECLPDDLQRTVIEFSRCIQSPPEFVALPMLAVLAAAIGVGLEIKTWHASLRANLFVLLVAASGTGKSFVARWISQPLRNIERQWHSYWKTTTEPESKAAVRIQQSLIEVLEKEAKKASDGAALEQIQSSIAKAEQELERAKSQLSAPQMTVADITREKLALALGKHPRECLASISGEARGPIDVVMGRYNKKTDEDIYLASFSGDSCRIDRMNGTTVNLHRPCLTLFWAFQPDKLDELVESKSMMESGFLARCLIVRPDVKVQQIQPDHSPPSQLVQEKWESLVNTIAQKFYFNREAITLNPPEAVASLLRDFHNAIARDLSDGQAYSGLESFASRWTEQAWKLLLILHVATHGEKADSVPIEPDSAGKAITIMKWLIQRQLAILAPVQFKRKQKCLDDLLSTLIAYPAGQCTIRELKCRNSFSEEVLEQLAAEHPDRICIETISPKGPGRKSRVMKLVV